MLSSLLAPAWTRRVLGLLAATGLALSGCYEPNAEDSGLSFLPAPVDPDPYVAIDSPAELARALGQPEELLIGLGNDLPPGVDTPHAWSLSEVPPLHYLYLVGLPGRSGWPTWNPGGTFVDLQAAAALKQRSVPVFTLYAMAVEGEGRVDVLTDRAYMEAWWTGYELALTRLAHFGRPAILHLEPDFWGFMQLHGGPDPDQIPAKVGSVNPHCADLPETLAGFGQCIVKRARTGATNVRIGFHASAWADPDPVAVAEFLLDVGAADTDVLVVETLDRDAGCFEARGDACTRNDGPWYWNDSGQGAPGFLEHLDSMQILHEVTGLPLLWWQMPMGVPSGAPGGVPGHYRDNRVAWFFDHPERFADAGGLGVMFGPGWTGQTDLTTDGGQFASLWAAYHRAPVSIADE